MDIRKVDREIAAGRLWRAKEMLQGYLSQSTFDVRLLEKYGQVLLAMGDLLEAGRYLFASGVRRAEYAQPIALFLDRHSKADSSVLLGEMPAMIRRHKATLGGIIPTTQFAEADFLTKSGSSSRGSQPKGKLRRAPALLSTFRDWPPSDSSS